MKKKIVTFGEVLLRLTSPGYLRFSQGSEFVATYGGSEANVAVSLANFGFETEFVTRLPENDIAKACLMELRSHNVGTKEIVFGGERLGAYFIETAAVSRGAKVVYDRANSAFETIQPGMINWREVFKDAGWFHWSGIAAALSQGAAEACKEAVEIASEMGLTISCDINYRKNLWKYGKTPAEVMPELVAHSDVLFGTEEEYRQVFGIEPAGFRATSADYKMDEEGFERMCKEVIKAVPRCKKVLVALRYTINANHNFLGGVLYSDNKIHCSKVYDVTHVVDCVGVGDAFMGALIYAMITYPKDDKKALAFGAAASCLKNTIYGDFNLVSVSEVENLMKGDGSGRVSR